MKLSLKSLSLIEYASQIYNVFKYQSIAYNAYFDVELSKISTPHIHTSMQLIIGVQAQLQYEIIQQLPSGLQLPSLRLADGSCCLATDFSPDCSKCVFTRVDLCLREIDHPQNDFDITNCPLGRRQRDQPSVGGGNTTITNTAQSFVSPTFRVSTINRASM